MILRRPYAFLIKHFRIIHLVMFVLLAFITFKANNTLIFFRDYIANNGNIEVIASSYISYLIFVFAILIIALSLIIYFLMRYKKKPRFLYIVIIIVSIISMIITSYLYFNIRTLEISAMTAREIRLLRDISRFNFWGLFITCIPVLIRGLGFDIKRFNFNKDLSELKLEKEDSEEVEVNVEINSDTVKRTGRKLFRELKYYYAENKFFINIMLGVVLLILIMMFPFNRFVLNRDLAEGEVLGTNYFNFKVVDSYVSERKRVSKNNCYLIIKFDIAGKVNKYSLNLDHFVLKSKDREYIPSLKYYYYFDDIGNGYRNGTLSTGEYTQYIFVYNIDIKDKYSKFTLNYLGNDRKIKLNPEYLD